MTPAEFLIAALAIAVSVSIYLWLRRELHRIDAEIALVVTEFEPLPDMPVIERVRELETAAAQFDRKMESLSNDERRSPFPDWVDEMLIGFETIGA